ncbi:glycosyl hydrolase family 18 protein [Lentisphaerota bacterium ZTH]|nr:beta-N-acetylglucosaminidase domain-containing protein [Lentisphaerota bacterium]WET05345.1 glycosyl hydrolase family 18 protein [Lentisphaerota bacterium ZTH]
MRVSKKVSALITALVVLFSAGMATTCNAIIIGGYWENWNSPINPVGSDTSAPSYYSTDLENFNYVYYSFLTLDQHPNPDNPQSLQWDGNSIYESMTAADVITVMTETDPAWDNPYNWQRVKIAAIIQHCQENNKKFIWAIGGWSDLTKTISDAQVDTFVSKCVQLLQLGGDGIDFDWEHLSSNADILDQQRAVLGKVLYKLRKSLDDNNMSDKLIGYTTRFNAFWSTAPDGVTSFESDGEGIAVNNAIKAYGSTLDQVVDWVNIMMYDVPPTDLGAAETFTLEQYKMVLEYFAKEGNVSKEKIVMGFEPGNQAAGGVWEGAEVDQSVIDYIKANGYGGIMFWAVNEKASTPTTTGQNAQDLAKYANQ